MTTLADLISSFAALLCPDPGNDRRLQEWIAAARAADLSHLHVFTRGLDLDIQATIRGRSPSRTTTAAPRESQEDQDD